MEWYLAKLVYRIICGSGSHTAQFDEQLRLVVAEDELHAYNKAQKIGENEQESFYNQNKQLVNWKFINVTELHKLEQLSDGAEVYSRIYEEEEGENYQHVVQVKSRYLSEYCTDQFLQTI